MKSLKFFALLWLLCQVAVAAAQYPMAWTSLKDLGQVANETPIQLTPAPGGGFFACGTDEGSTIVTKIGSTGTVSWTKIVPGSFSDMASNAIGIATVGSVGWLTDRSFNSHFSNYNVVTRYDLSGNIVWTRWIPDPSSSNGRHVAVDSSGNVIVNLQSGSSQELLKFDSANGNQSIDILLTNSTGDASVATDSTNSIYVAEQTSAYPNPDNATLFKYSSTGTLLWGKSLTQGRAPRVVVDSSDNPYLIFNFLYASGNQVYKYDPNGNLIWNTTSPTPTNVRYVALSSGGALLLGNSDMGSMNVTYVDSAGTVQWSQHLGNWGGPVYFDSLGNPYAVYSNFNVALISKFDTAGSVLWTNSRPLGSQQSGDGYRMRLAVDSAGLAAMMVPTPLEPSQDLGTYAFTSDGTSTWNLNYDAHRTFDRAYDSVTDAGGNTYVSAIAQGSTNPCAIIKYSTNGSVSWSRVLPQLTGVGKILTPRLAGDGVVVGQTYYMSNTGEATGLSVHRFNGAGNQLWSYTSVGPEDLKDVEVAGDGSIYLSIAKTTNQFQVPPYSLRVKRLSSSGQLQWTADRTGQINRYQQWSKLAIDAIGNAYVSFPTLQPNSSESPTITKIDANGYILWSVVAEIAQSGPLPGDDLALDSNGNPYLLVTDFSGPETLYKYDPNGAFVWSVPLDVLRSRSYLSIDASDNIFVGGFDYSINNQGPEIQKLDTSGNRVWAKYLSRYTPQTIFRMLPDSAGGVYCAIQVYSVYPAVGTCITRITSNGSQPWPSSGGAFINGSSIYFPAGQMQDECAGLGVDALGDVFMSSSVYGSTGSYDVDVKKYAASNSSFVVQSIPTSMSAGETYQATMTVQNTGLNPWTKAEGYKLSVLNGSTWGVSSIGLNPADTIAPGQSKVFKFFVYAPTIGGVYTFQCKMYKNTSSFGPLSTSIPVVVTVNPYAARYVSEIAPATVSPGSTFSVTVDMRNVGTKVWTKAAGFALAPVIGEPTWGVSAIQLDASDSVSQGADKVFTFNCIAPSAAGSYTMRWQMKAGANYFGDRTIGRTIDVVP